MQRLQTEDEIDISQLYTDEKILTKETLRDMKHFVVDSIKKTK